MAGGSVFEVVVVGAGAAGLAAAHTLLQAGVGTLVLEARDRIGGRAWTVPHGSCALDLGCGWLHSAETNPWCGIAEDLGFFVDRTPSPWGRQAGGRGFSAAEQAEFHRASAAFYARIEAAAAAGVDAPAARWLEPGNRWNGLIGAVGTYINGVEFDRLSIIDYDRYADSGINWRIREGYGALIAAYGRDVPVRLNCSVSTIDHSGATLRLATGEGEVLAKKVLITVPPTLIAAGRLRFHPELPDKQAAAAALPLGVADKLLLAIEAPEAVPKDGHVLGRIDRIGTGSYHLRPLDRPIIEGYFGGELARELERGGTAAFLDFALEELGGLFGHAVRSQLKPIASTAWHGDPFSLGSYSYAMPGHSDDRAVLAASVDQRLYFAGEACSRHDFSTAHGAYRTGLAAATAMLAAAKQKHWPHH